jgi:hypothetical protein
LLNQRIRIQIAVKNRPVSRVLVKIDIDVVRVLFPGKLPDAESLAHLSRTVDHERHFAGFVFPSQKLIDGPSLQHIYNMHIFTPNVKL